MTIRLRLTCLALVLAGAAGLSSGLDAQTSGTPERFIATAVSTTGGATAQVQIAVDRWSTNAERDRLTKTLLDKGPEALLDVLRDTPRVGFIRQTSAIGWDLHYAARTPLPDGGERVVVGTDRPISAWEAYNQTRTVDYPFTIVELRLNADGEGVGKMTYATKVTVDKKTNSVVLENWGTTPILLQGVHRETTNANGHD